MSVFSRLAVAKLGFRAIKLEGECCLAKLDERSEANLDVALEEGLPRASARQQSRDAKAGAAALVLPRVPNATAAQIIMSQATVTTSPTRPVSVRITKKRSSRSTANPLVSEPQDAASAGWARAEAACDLPARGSPRDGRSR